MSVVWLVFVLITGRILATATLFADRVAASTHRARRFVWLAGLVATVLWPAIAYGIYCAIQVALAHGIGVGGGGMRPHDGALLRLLLPRAWAPRWVDETFLIAWGCVSLVMAVRLANGWRAVNRWRRTMPIATVDGVTVRVSPSIGPAVVGVRETEVVLPTWALALDTRERSLVLRHELCHRDARDPCLFQLAEWLPVLTPWNVFAWWQARRLRLAIEMDCDARVLRVDPRPVEYARLLVSIAERWSLTGRLPRGLPALVAQGSRLEYRLAAIAERGVQATRRRVIVFAAVSVVSVALAVAIECPIRPGARGVLQARGDFVGVGGRAKLR